MPCAASSMTHESVPVGDLARALHLAADARVVHRQDRRVRGVIAVLDERLVEVERVLADVDEDGHAAPQDDGVRGRDEA